MACPVPIFAQKPKKKMLDPLPEVPVSPVPAATVKPVVSPTPTTAPSAPTAPKPDDILLPPRSASPLTAVPIRLKLAATEPASSVPDATTAFGITSLEVRTPVPNLWFGLTDLSLPLAPGTLRESPSTLLDTLSTSTPVLTYRLKF